MYQAAQPSRSYKISLAWRYNSFSLYVSCQIYLASPGAVLLLSHSRYRKIKVPRVPGEHVEKYLHVQCPIVASLHHAESALWNQIHETRQGAADMMR